MQGTAVCGGQHRGWGQQVQITDENERKEILIWPLTSLSRPLLHHLWEMGSEEIRVWTGESHGTILAASANDSNMGVIPSMASFFNGYCFKNGLYSKLRCTTKSSALLWARHHTCGKPITIRGFQTILECPSFLPDSSFPLSHKLQWPVDQHCVVHSWSIYTTF